MMKVSLKTGLVVALLVLVGNVYAKNETQYAAEHCASIGGDLEHSLPNNTRVDCITEMTVIEYDFTYKWYECITQALYYRMLTGKQAMCGLIRKNGTAIEERRIERAWETIRHYQLPVFLFEVER